MEQQSFQCPECMEIITPGEEHKCEVDDDLKPEQVDEVVLSVHGMGADKKKSLMHYSWDKSEVTCPAENQEDVSRLTCRVGLVTCEWCQDYISKVVGEWIEQQR